MNEGTDLPEGLPAELIDRLVEVADVGPTKGGAWHELAWWLKFSLAGDWFSGVFIDTGVEYPPGTMGARQRARAKKIVTREQYWDLVRERLSELVLSGVNEAFLIRSLRDELRRRLAEDAWVGTNDQKRFDLAERMFDAADDLDMIAAFRARLAKKDPSVASKSDAEISEMLYEMALDDMLLKSTPIEAAVDRWAVLAHWDDDVTFRLSDEAIELWLDRYARRITDAIERD